MTQPRQDDADSQQESEEKAETQPPQQADGGTADEIADEAVNKEADTQAEEGDDSPAGEDQDSGGPSRGALRMSPARSCPRRSGRAAPVRASRTGPHGPQR